MKRKHNQLGSALVLVIVMVAVITMTIGYFGRKSLLTTWYASGQKEEKFLRVKTREILDRIQTSLVQKVQLAVDNARPCISAGTAPRPIFCSAQQAQSSINLCQGSPVCFPPESIYAAASTESVQIRPVGEADPSSQSSLKAFQVTSSSNPNTMPKIFNIQISMTGESGKSVGTLNSEIAVGPQPFNRFAYLVTRQREPTVGLGANDYGGSVGIFFAPTLSDGRDGSNGRVLLQNIGPLTFRELFTVSGDESSLIPQENIDSSFPGGDRNYMAGVRTSGTSPGVDWENTFTGLKTANSTIKGNPITRATESIITLGSANSDCDIVVEEVITRNTCAVSGGGSGGGTTGFKMRQFLFENYRPTLVASLLTDYLPFILVGPVNPGDGVGPGGLGGGEITITCTDVTETHEVCRNQSCGENTAIYVRGMKTTVQTASGQSFIPVCTRHTFISDGSFYLKAGIRKWSAGGGAPQDPSLATVAFVATGNESKAAVLDSNTVTELSGNPTLGMLQSQGGVNDATADTTSIRLEASFIGTGELGGSVAVEDALLSTSGGTFTRYGNIEITGSMVGANVFPTRQLMISGANRGRYSGFQKVTSNYDTSLQGANLPGFSASSSTQLGSQVQSISFRYDNIEEALASIGAASIPNP